MLFITTLRLKIELLNDFYFIKKFENWRATSWSPDGQTHRQTPMRKCKIMSSWVSIAKNDVSTVLTILLTSFSWISSNKNWDWRTYRPQDPMYWLHTGSWFIISRSLGELISRVLEKIERIHNMPWKAEHVSFQGEKMILKIGAWVTELFYFLCSYSDFVRAETFFSHNSYVSEPIQV